jgi:uncharacterized repeat protein (TIGR01451 family)
MMMKIVKMKTVYAAALVAAAATGSVLAGVGTAKAQGVNAAAVRGKPAVSLTSTALIERRSVDAAGKETVQFKTPSEVLVVPGDKVVFTLTYINNGSEPATAFRAVNPMPGAIQFLSTAQDWAEVSVDGGNIWGKLSDLRVAQNNPASSDATPVEGQKPSVPGPLAVSRAATAEDVTHIRWVFVDAIAAGAKGELSYSGVVK